jgi:choline kinase
MKAVLLAAGAGTRLTGLTTDIPKALVSVRGRPLVDYVLSYTGAGPIEEVVVIGGYHGELLQEHLEGREGLRFFLNPDFRKGNLLSLLAARPALEGDLLLLNVDHIFPRRLLRSFLESSPARGEPTAFVDFDRPLYDDDMKVDLGDDGRVRNISKVLERFQAGYIGSTFVPAGTVDRYLAAATSVCERSQGMANVEAVLQYLADAGSGPRVFDASGIRWLEVDTPQDHANAERILANIEGYLD